MKFTIIAALAAFAITATSAGRLRSYSPSASSAVAATPTEQRHIDLFGKCTPENEYEGDCIAGYHTRPHFPVSINGHYYLPGVAYPTAPLASASTSKPANSTSWSFTHGPKMSVWSEHTPSTLETRTKGWYGNSTTASVSSGSNSTTNGTIATMSFGRNRTTIPSVSAFSTSTSVAWVDVTLQGTTVTVTPTPSRTAAA